ncbi:hypothetical protein [Streptomyces griseus]|uniref:hypothetical protein n=1 Tax=Streptomyces griseus TaxID=1911 RepID=UPI001F18C55A|nr:hypothetical protein [Streptomyces griseus]
MSATATSAAGTTAVAGWIVRPFFHHTQRGHTSPHRATSPCINRLPRVDTTPSASPISSIPGVSRISRRNSSVIPRGWSKYQAIRVMSYGSVETTATSTARRPHLRSPAVSVVSVRAPGPCGARPQCTQRPAVRRRYARVAAAQSSPPTKTISRFPRCQ